MSKITILTCVYNCERYIGACIDSVLSQTFPDFEYLIIDDGSSDKSSAVIRKHAKVDKRVKYIFKKNTGLTNSLNYGIKLASSDYIIRLDADDLMSENRVAEVYKYISSNNYDLIVNRSRYIDSESEFIRYGPFIKSIERGLKRGFSPFSHSSVAFRKESIEAIGLYDEFFSRSQDYELWLRMISNNYKVYVINDFLSDIRLHDASLTNEEVDKYSLLAHIKYQCALNAHKNEFIFTSENKEILMEWLSKTITFSFYYMSLKFLQSVKGFSFKRFKMQSARRIFFYFFPFCVYRTFNYSLRRLMYFQFINNFR